VTDYDNVGNWKTVSTDMTDITLWCPLLPYGYII